MSTSSIIKFSLHPRTILIFSEDVDMTDTSNNSGINFSCTINKLDYYYGNRNKLEQWKTQIKRFFNFHEVFVDKQILIATKYFCG